MLRTGRFAGCRGTANEASTHVSSENFCRIGREVMCMKETILGCIVYPIAFGALIGLTIGIADTFLKTPFDPYLFLTIW